MIQPSEIQLDLTPLQRATARLRDVLDLCQSAAVQSDPRLRQHLEAGAIQAFEFTQVKPAVGLTSIWR